MPNWSMNRLYFKNEKELEKFKEKTFTDGHFDFNRIIPMPEHQPDLDKPNPFVRNWAIGNEEIKKFGENNWYSWSCENWGTKWNATETYCSKKWDDGHWISFDTAWSPPLKVIEELGKTYEIDFRYMLEGIDGVSRIVYKNSKLEFEDFYNDDLCSLNSNLSYNDEDYIHVEDLGYDIWETIDIDEIRKTHEELKNKD